MFRHQDIRVLPSSQTSEEGPEIPWAAAPVPPIGTHPCRRRRGPFVYPEPNRRMRTKTTPPSQDIEELAQAAEEAMAVDDSDLEIKLDQMNYDADAEAAAAMGLDE